MTEKIKGFGETFSPDEIAEQTIKGFVEKENEKNVDLGNIGIWGHDLDAEIMTKLKSLEDADRSGDANLLAHHILFKLNSATFEGQNIHGEEITKGGSDEIKKAAIESLEKYLRA